MRLNWIFRVILSLFAPKNLTLAIDNNWSINITNINWMKLNASNCCIYRPDGQYFTIKFTDAFGYLFPAVFEVANKNGVAGNIATTVRQSEKNGIEVLAEETKAISPDGKKVIEIRATRSSISNADGSPIPSGTKGYSIIHLSPGETNNMRISGRVDCHGILKNQDFVPSDKKFFIPLEDYLQSTDLPGQGVLLKYFLTQAAQTAKNDAPKHGVLLNYLVGLYGKENIQKLLAE